MTLRVERVIPEHLADVWLDVKPLLDRALERGVGQFEANDLLGLLVRQERQLWLGNRGNGIEVLCITRIMDHPQKRSMYISHFVGDLAGVKQIWPHLKAFAKQYGCSFVMHEGRRGWGGKGILPAEFRHSADIWVAEVE